MVLPRKEAIPRLHECRKKDSPDGTTWEKKARKTEAEMDGLCQPGEGEGRGGGGGGEGEGRRRRRNRRRRKRKRKKKKKKKKKTTVDSCRPGFGMNDHTCYSTTYCKYMY